MPLASTGAIAIKNGRLFAETEERLQRLSMLHTIDTAISSSLELRVTLNILINELTSMPGFKAADVLLYDPARQVLELAAGRGYRSDVSAIRIGEGLAGRAALEGKTIACTGEDSDCYTAILGHLPPPEEFAGYIALPLVNKGQIRGVLEVYCREARFISVEWLEFLETLAGQAAIAIDNNLLVNQLQRSNLELMLAYDSTLEGWSKALDLRDRETEGHSQRVTELTIKLAEAMGLQGLDLVHIRRGSLLHDIGKMGIPDSILLKEGPLNPDEWVIMRKHPDYAFEMLSPINYLSKSLDIPYCHHEHWDGKGYPRGLKEEQIPLAARIFAIADVFDSLVSDRPYRKAWTKEKALEQIKIESGTHLDAHIVNIFLKIMEE
jgi:putative nucleotidyltransferase with HDIG domain